MSLVRRRPGRRLCRRPTTRERRPSALTFKPYSTEPVIRCSGPISARTALRSQRQRRRPCVLGFGDVAGSCARARRSGPWRDPTRLQRSRPAAGTMDGAGGVASSTSSGWKLARLRAAPGAGCSAAASSDVLITRLVPGCAAGLRVGTCSRLMHGCPRTGHAPAPATTPTQVCRCGRSARPSFVPRRSPRSPAHHDQPANIEARRSQPRSALCRARAMLDELHGRGRGRDQRVSGAFRRFSFGRRQGMDPFPPARDCWF